MERHRFFGHLTEAEFLRQLELHVAAINLGIEGIPRDRIRLHVCWGNNDGPHIHDIAMAAILPELYRANVGALSIEFANPRHQHEYDALRNNPLPAHMLLMPGVLDTTTNIVEHPEVVAQRLEEAVSAVGDRERVIAGTDCGFGTFAGREYVAEEIVWVKLAAAAEGARIASRTLWGKSLRSTAPEPQTGNYFPGSCTMKITIEADCTPDEARRFLGLPDVAPMQAAMMEKIQQRMADAIDATTPEALLKLWMPMSPDQIQKAFVNLFDAFSPKKLTHFSAVLTADKARGVARRAYALLPEPGVPRSRGPCGLHQSSLAKLQKAPSCASRRSGPDPGRVSCEAHSRCPRRSLVHAGPGSRRYRAASR